MSKKVPIKPSSVAREPQSAVHDSQINKLMKLTPKFDFRQQLAKPRESPVQTNLINATKNCDVKKQKIEMIYDHVRGDVQKQGGARGPGQNRDCAQHVHGALMGKQRPSRLLGLSASRIENGKDEAMGQERRSRVDGMVDQYNLV